MGLHADETTQARLERTAGRQGPGRAARRLRSARPHRPDDAPGERLRSCSPRPIATWPGPPAAPCSNVATRPVGTDDSRKQRAPRVPDGPWRCCAATRPKPRSTPCSSERSKLLKGYLSDDDFSTCCASCNWHCSRQDRTDETSELRAQLSEEYPARDARMNRELVRLLVYLQEPTLAAAAGRAAEQRRCPASRRCRSLMHARFLTGRLDRAAQARSAQGLRRRPRDAGRPQLCRLYRKRLARLLRHVRRRRAADGAGRRRQVADLGACRCWPSCPNIPAPKRWPRSNSSTARSRSSTAKPPSACGSASAPCWAPAAIRRDGLSARTVRQRARPPRADRHGTGAAAGRRELAVPGARRCRSSRAPPRRKS